MENRIDATFNRLQAEGKSAFIAYVCAGDPTPEKTVEIVAALEEAGADIVELGVPFSDPLADGVVNQMAADRALKAGTTVAKVLDIVREIRKMSQVPIVLFTYLNPIYTYGFEKFQEDVAEAGVDGILDLDLPPDEAGENDELDGPSPLRQIRLIAPTTPAERISTLAAGAEGFIYYVSREGVTGAQTTLSEGIAEQVAEIKKSAKVPVAVGFGISTPEQAGTVAEAADGVVVGSAIVRMIEQYGDSEELTQKLKEFVQPLTEATHR